jgi:hypothetical protein
VTSLAGSLGGTRYASINRGIAGIAKLVSRIQIEGISTEITSSPAQAIKAPSNTSAGSTGISRFVVAALAGKTDCGRNAVKASRDGTDASGTDTTSTD